MRFFSSEIRRRSSIKRLPQVSVRSRLQMSFCLTRASSASDSTILPQRHVSLYRTPSVHYSSCPPCQPARYLPSVISPPTRRILLLRSLASMSNILKPTTTALDDPNDPSHMGTSITCHSRHMRCNANAPAPSWQMSTCHHAEGPFGTYIRIFRQLAQVSVGFCSDRV